MTRANGRGRLVTMLVAGTVVVGAAGQSADDSWLQPYRAAAERIIKAATASRAAWDRLAELTDLYPARLSGSPNLEGAIRWATDQMTRDGLQNVRAEKVMVPHWVRGRESAELVKPTAQALAIAALGGSVGTPPEGLEAEALIVSSYDDLTAKAAQAKGRIVVYNVPYRLDVPAHVAYRQGTQYRGQGASRAAAHGAVAALVRSVGPTGHRTPHTGGMRYAQDQPKIPVAAISAEDAEKLQRMQDRGQSIVIRLRMEANTLPDVESANVIGELRGRELPDEIAVIGCHLDSWDLAAGAIDDGGGCIATWEAVRLLKTLGLVPRRTVRLVLFTNEENGLRGGSAYRDAHAGELAKHVMALESDSGVLDPIGFAVQGTPQAKAVVQQIVSLLDPVGLNRVSDNFDGADIMPMIRASKVPGVSLETDMTRYFFLHHTPADTVDKIDPAHLARAVAGIAIVTYVVADMPQVLDRAAATDGGQ